jgi:hypothetical protein
MYIYARAIAEREAENGTGPFRQKTRSQASVRKTNLLRSRMRRVGLS